MAPILDHFRKIALPALLAATASAAPAQVRLQDVRLQDDGLTEGGYAYVAGTVLSIFYHELGHALVDVMELPLFGPEEDAADTLAAVLTQEIWDEEGARQNAGAFALSWLVSASEGDEEAMTFADLHALDLQRHYRHVCLFYGADPAEREDFAELFELPQERAASCSEEYDQAARAWGAVLEQLASTEGVGLEWHGEDEGEIPELLAQEVADLNERYSLPEAISVHLLQCDEINAFYLSDEKAIVICQEFIDYLTRQAEEMDL